MIFGPKLEFSYILILLLSKCDLVKLKKHTFDAMMNTDYHIFCGRNLKLIIISHFHSLPSPIQTFYALTKWLVIIAVDRWP